jgi:hypothetical protein
MLMCCVCAFLLHRESPDIILGDEPLISVVVLSQTRNCYFMVLPIFYVSFWTTRAPLTTECVVVSYSVPRKRERSLYMCAQDVQITRIVII